MTKDEIMELARSTGVLAGYEGEPSFLVIFALAMRDAGAAAEREKVAAWMIQRSYATGHGDTIEDLLVELEWQVRESEREACAKVCEEAASLFGGSGHIGVCITNAGAIRARGEKI